MNQVRYTCGCKWKSHMRQKTLTRGKFFCMVCSYGKVDPVIADARDGSLVFKPALKAILVRILHCRE